MPNLDPTDQQLLQIVSAAQPVTIADVIQVMQSIDALLPNNDGLKWFNKLYLIVTQEIDGQPPATAWSDPAWLTGLDVVFAGFTSRHNGKLSQAMIRKRRVPGALFLRLVAAQILIVFNSRLPV